MITPGMWSYACDSYGKVRHSRMACVFSVVTNGERVERLVRVASRIDNWGDASAIALLPFMLRYVTEKAGEGDERAGIILEAVNSNDAHRAEVCSQRLEQAKLAPQPKSTP